MADLKPIGSEKLTGQDKLNRIMEIARFKEVAPKTTATANIDFFIKQIIFWFVQVYELFFKWFQKSNSHFDC